MKEITCSNCHFTAPKNDMERICSNCFACTGCVRFICPKCGGEITEVPMQGFRLKQSSKTDKK